MINPQQLVSNALKSINEISVDQLAMLSQKPNFNLIDIREASEIADGVIPGSFWISRGLLEFKILSLVEHLNWHENDEIYITCRSGNRSALAAVSLLEMGFKKPISVAGGFNAWRDSGFDIAQEILSI